MMSPGAGSDGQDFELNLASIIDCLTVIIAFLLLSSSFVSYGALDTAVAAPQSTKSTHGSEENPQSLTLSAKILEDDRVELEISGKRTEKKRIARDSLRAELQALKAKYPGLEGMVLSAGPRLPYREVIRGMDEARTIFPAVALGLSGGRR